jgi:HTH-type transcriptional regulator, sugar sensing transcriptional regulator
MANRLEAIANRLTELGFSQYEARTYLGLLTAESATGYSVANATGVPQPKVYETLRRLVERGAAVRTGDNPGRYSAVAPDTLLRGLEQGFAGRVEAVRRDLETLPSRAAVPELMSVHRVESFPAAVERASAAIAGARTRVYLSGRRDELTDLGDAVAQGTSAGAEFVLVHFGKLPFATPPGTVVRHASTDGALYRQRRARHLAVVVDSTWCLWGVAKDGKQWDILISDAPLLAGLVKAYIRHDLFVQRIFADFPAELEERYGSGLLELASLSATVGQAVDEPREGAG